MPAMDMGQYAYGDPYADMGKGKGGKGKGC
jgi:hypothetical protein